MMLFYNLITDTVMILLLLITLAFANEAIYLDNASFEGTPQDAMVPVGWFPCERGTTPDILPGPWGVYQEASEGETFVGLITREDGSFESIGQRLKSTLSIDKCYEFTLDLAHSNTYNGYTGAIKLRIWGGTVKCEKRQVLLESKFIEHADWETYKVEFRPEMPINYILIEAYYKDGRFSHKGNILIDNISAIKKCARV